MPGEIVTNGILVFDFEVFIRGRFDLLGCIQALFAKPDQQLKARATFFLLNLCYKFIMSGKLSYR